MVNEVVHDSDRITIRNYQNECNHILSALAALGVLCSSMTGGFKYPVHMYYVMQNGVLEKKNSQNPQI